MSTDKKSKEAREVSSTSTNSLDLLAPDSEKTLTWFSGMCMIIGLMIGSGIFTNGGKVYSLVGSPGMAIVLWVLGGILSLAATFCYIELGTMIPSNGGEQAYLHVAFSRPRAFWSFMFCWSMILLVRPGAAAADSFITSEYVLSIFDITDPWIQKGVGILVISSITLMNVLSTKWAIRIHDGLTMFKMLTLIMVVFCGILVSSNAISLTIDSKPTPFSDAFKGTSTNPGDYASALFKIFWAYDGFTNLNYAVGDLQNPKKNLPKAAGLGVSIVTILYVCANIAFFTAIPLEDMATVGSLLTKKYFENIFGPVFGNNVVPILVAVSAYGAVCSMVFVAARIIRAAAKVRILPLSIFWEKEHPTLKTPVNALMLNWAITSLLLIGPPAGTVFDFMVDMVSYPAWFFYGLSFIGLITMRKSHPHLDRSIRVWLIIPVIMIGVCLFLLIFPWFPNSGSDFPSWAPNLGGVVALSLGLPVYYFFVMKNANPPNMDF